MIQKPSLQRSTLHVDGLSFSAISAGPQDGELVMLLHGFPQFADAWSDIVLALAANGFHAFAPDQRGYSAGARPTEVESYAVSNLASDVLGFADVLGATNFHLIGHDWGGFLAWKLAADHPDRVRSLCVLCTPHIDAFWETMETDPDQQERSKYIEFFKMPGHVAEGFFLENGGERLRRVYQDKVPEPQVSSNLRRLTEPGALTSVLNWYRALDTARVGTVHVPTLYLWGSQDLAAGRTAAEKTGQYVDAPYQFKTFEGYSHWLLSDADPIKEQILEHLNAFRTDSKASASDNHEKECNDKG
jgi:pimeloyl-ACP methyl ester carboxylesterase